MDGVLEQVNLHNVTIGGSMIHVQFFKGVEVDAVCLPCIFRLICRPFIRPWTLRYGWPSLKQHP